MNTPSAAVDSEVAAFGARIRALRVARGWTLDEVAARAGLSQAYVSRLEAGERQPSLATVFTLARTFGVAVASLFEQAPADEPCTVVRAADQSLQAGHDMWYALLVGGRRNAYLHAMRVIIPATREGADHFQHEGEEWLYLLSGELHLSVAGHLYHLVPGDAAHFDATLPHRLIAAPPRDAELLVVACTVPHPLPGWWHS